MKLSSKQHDLAFLNSEFENISFDFFASDDSLYCITCIACWCKTSTEVTSNWRAIQNLVSVHHQPPGELARWNIYLAFFCKESLPIWEKYVIQNDKYSVRKIIIDGLEKLPDSTEAELILNNHLLGADLKLKDKDRRVEQEAALSMTRYISGAPLDSTGDSRRKRAEMINNIIEFLNKDENQKS